MTSLLGTRSAFVVVPYDTGRFWAGECLGPRYLAGAVRRAGGTADLFELSLNPSLLLTLRERCSGRYYDLVGFSIPFTEHVEPTLAFIGDVFGNRPRGARPTVAVGGQATTFIWQRILDASPSVDVACCFEGEETILDLLSVCRHGRHPDPGTVPGVYSRGMDGRVRSAGDRQTLADITALALPARDGIPRSGDAVAVLTSRGCHGGCTFCLSGNFGNPGQGETRWRARAAADVVDEIVRIQRDLGVSVFSLVDDTFLGGCPAGRLRAFEFADLLSSGGIRIRWSMECRADECEPELLQVLYQAGLRFVFLGIDGGNPDDLRLFGKRLSLDENRNAVEVCRRAGLDVDVGLIMFHPRTSCDGVASNLAFLKSIEHCTYLALTNHVRLYRGSPLARHFARDIRATGRFAIDYECADPRVEAIRTAFRRVLAPARIADRDIGRALFECHVDELNGVSSSERRARVRTIQRQHSLALIEMAQSLCDEGAVPGAGKERAWTASLDERAGACAQACRAAREALNAAGRDAQPAPPCSAGLPARSTGQRDAVGL